MSEYQYYEFQAIDRPLSDAEMRTLRQYSSRATITPTRFMNSYSWGSFKGDTGAWMEEYFDAFLYLANWGTHELMFRFPRTLLDPETAKRYCIGENASAAESDDHVVLSFLSELEGGDDWLDEDGGVLASILPVRAEIAGGDYRALYLGWLLCAQEGDLDDEEPEPPVPAGLGEPSAAQAAFCEFLRIDPDLVAAASERSPALSAGPGEEEVRAWVAALPDEEKAALLVRVMEGRGGMVGAELLRRMCKQQPTAYGSGEPRTVESLLDAAERNAAERRRAVAERAARAKAVADAERAEARVRYLDRLSKVERQTWEQVDALIATRQPQRYDDAVQLLVDLRDLGRRDGREDEALARIEEIATRHERKGTFLSRLRSAIPHRTVLFGENP